MYKSLCVKIDILCLIILSILLVGASFAKDTDIYKVDDKNNCYLLMDSSGSMNFGVYEYTIDYGAMFDYFFTLNDNPDGDYYDYIYDTVTNSSYFYQNHQPRNKIYVWKGRIGVTVVEADGKTIAFTGDAADPNYLWYMSDLVDTHTVIDDDGNLSDDGTGLQRLTEDSEGHILFDGQRLPLGQDIKLHDYSVMYDGSVVDNGFGGLLNAPGYYFSGYEDVSPLNVAEDGDSDIFFFVTGNWINMQAMYNLHYTTSSGLPSGASKGDMAWPYEPFPISQESWSQEAYSLKYPDPAKGDPTYSHPYGSASCPVHDPWCWSAPGDVTYINGLDENDTARTITHPGAAKIQVHFSKFDVEQDFKDSSYLFDYVALYDGAGNRVAIYDNDNSPINDNDGWSAVVPGDTVVIKLKSDSYRHSKGYEIDKIRVVYSSDDDGNYYYMQSRLDVAKDAMSYVVTEFMNRINWGFATFGNNADGADIKSTVNFNPSDQDDVYGEELLNHISQVEASGGTPLGEALQDLYIDGYYQHSNAIDNHSCRKSFIIAMTDGYPSADEDWRRISDGGNTIVFDDWDGDGWTNDPYQYYTPPPDYYDDVAHWLYTHSWMKSDEFGLVDDPANSYKNIITHHISFGAHHPLLEDAAAESGGEYIATYNKAQLISAFHSLGLMISQAVSFTAPVVSVDSANKIQSGDSLYMGLFMPKADQTWVGNLKKFKLGDGSAERPDPWMIYDASNHVAIDTSGQFLDNTDGFWGDENDSNDSDSNGYADITEDGVGEVLLEQTKSDFDAGNYYSSRHIYTYKSGAIVSFDQSTITAGDLQVADDATRNKIINWVYGYTYDADATGKPVAPRNWVLGAIIHSRPVVIDYFDTTDPQLPLLKRYIAVGANDGMLHVFDDDTGKEVFAFIPEDILPKLQLVVLNDEYDTVDGRITLYRRDGEPKYLIFGERRGGGAYWCLDIEDSDPNNWTVAWKYTNSEMVQSWSEAQIVSMLVGIDADTGERTYQDVVVVTGGYDPEEDNYPEPFNDINNDGTPYDENGNLLDSGTSKEWDSADVNYDVNNNNQYDKYNPDKDGYGRGIFVFDIDDPSTVVKASVNGIEVPVLPFSVTYGPVNVTTGTTQTLASMKYCFPASPSVVKFTETYTYKDENNHSVTAYEGSVLKTIYVSDIYADIFKIGFTANVENKGTEASPDWQLTTASWTVQKIFSGNPGSASSSGTFGSGVDISDQGRKSFFSPAISWGGSGDYFDSGNYRFEDTEFNGLDRIASIFFGTGDREHPRYTLIRNRIYAVYDDSSVSAESTVDGGGQAVNVSSAPYTEDDLLNLTCDELGESTVINSCYLGSLDGVCDSTADIDTISKSMKAYLRTLLVDDPIFDDSGVEKLENGVNENDAKGWYVVLEDQGTACDHCDYLDDLSTANDSSRDNHRGEKILSKPVLYFNTLYFTSYQPSYDDPCNPQGNGFVYALDYLDASAALNLNEGNDGEDSEPELDISDRYRKYTSIYGIPSGFTIVTRNGEAGAMASMGGMVVGPGENGPGYQIPSAGLGLELYYWREGQQ